MRTLCIDQAARLSGFAVFEDNKLIEWGTVEPRPKSLTGGPRLKYIYEKFEEIVDRVKPDQMVIEDPVGGQEDNRGPKANWKTMFVLANVYGVLELLAAIKGVPIDSVSPSSWQYTCGIHKRDRSSRKAGAEAFVEKQYGVAGTAQDIYDAICIGHHYLNKKHQEMEISAF